MATILKIKTAFATLAEAVAASKLDLSYNERSAQQTIRDTDRGYGRDPGVTRAFLMEDGTVQYLYGTDDGLTLLHEFDPFVSCLSGSPLRMVVVNEESGIIHISDLTVPKTKAGRKALAATGMIAC